MSGTLVFMSGDPVFMDATQRTPLDCLTLEGRGSCIPGPSTVTIREAVLDRLPLSGLYTESRLKYTQVFLRKRPICFIGTLTSGTGFQSCKLLGASGRALTEQRPMDTIFALPFTVIFQKGSHSFGA